MDIKCHVESSENVVYICTLSDIKNMSVIVKTLHCVYRSPRRCEFGRLGHVPSEDASRGVKSSAT